MNSILINLYRDRWVLTSSEQVAGGLQMDAQPVRLVQHDDKATLRRVLKEVADENIPVVPPPGVMSQRLHKGGIRAQAVGARDWPSFVKHARCFLVSERANTLVLEEWPKEGSSFVAKPSWQKTFNSGDLESVGGYLVETIPPIETASTAGRLPKAR